MNYIYGIIICVVLLFGIALGIWIGSTIRKKVPTIGEVLVISDEDGTYASLSLYEPLDIFVKRKEAIIIIKDLTQL